MEVVTAGVAMEARSTVGLASERAVEDFTEAVEEDFTEVVAGTREEDIDEMHLHQASLLSPRLGTACILSCRTSEL
jgi:hypothetical protein